MWHDVGMKPIQVTFDDALLERLDRHPMVRERGRSAVLREAAADFLARKDAKEIDRRYLAGYGGATPTGDELDGWSAEGAWPEPVTPDREAASVSGSGPAAATIDGPAGRRGVL